MQNKNIKLLIVSLSVFSVYGCTQNVGTSFSDSLKNFGNALDNQLSNASGEPSTAMKPGPRNYPTIQSTELHNIFKKYPIMDSNNPPEFPKVAIKVTAIAPSLLVPSPLSRSFASDKDCITFNATLWYSSKDPKRYTDLETCPKDVPYSNAAAGMKMSSVGGSQFGFWSGKAILGRPNTGEVRTEGPTPPQYTFPQDGNSRELIDSGNYVGLEVLFATIVYSLGSDIVTTLPGRLWFISVPSAPGSFQQLR